MNDQNVEHQLEVMADEIGSIADTLCVDSFRNRCAIEVMLFFVEKQYNGDMNLNAAVAESFDIADAMEAERKKRAPC